MEYSTLRRTVQKHESVTLHSLGSSRSFPNPVLPAIESPDQCLDQYVPSEVCSVGPDGVYNVLFGESGV